MRRALGILALTGAAAAAAAIGPFGGGDDAVRYRVVLDNSFGLTEGADFRTAGVKAGSVDTLDVETRTARAIATVKVSEGGFGTLKADATCEVLPQSLIGEYFLDCEPGRSRENLPDGGTVPVERTAGTVPPDLVQSILQRPERERLAILLSELGAGLASRGADVNTAIKRAVPALRETDRVLGILGDEQQRLRALIRDADVVVGRLADGRGDVARFVSEARDTAQASADRRDALRGSIQRFPEFQRQLRPVLADLSTVARRQTPALRDLRAAAGDLTTLLRRLGPFADATVPALVSLGAASDTGRRAVRVADETVARLRTFAAGAKEPSRNLRFVGEHIDDRSNAVEPHPESPGGAGYTGLEALLQYPFVQAQAINLFDSRGYTLKLNALINECTQYRNGESVKADETLRRTCSAAMGPNGPLEDEPAAAQQRTSRPQAAPERTTPQAPATPQPSAPQPSAPQAPATPQAPGLDLPDEIRIPGLPPIKLPPLLGGSRDDARPGSASTGLLDFLLGGGR